jgi:hypothetical protein
MKSDLEAPLVALTKDGDDEENAIPVAEMTPEQALQAKKEQRRGLIISMLTLIISIPALIGA